MIYANFKDANRYRGISPNLDIALEHINAEFLSALGEEQVELKGRDVYVFKIPLTTKVAAEALFENHHEYIDIHVVLEGAERMVINIPENLEPLEEKPESDLYFFRGNEGQAMILTPGNFLVAFSEDAHKTPGAVDDNPQNIVKAVFKVRL